MHLLAFELSSRRLALPVDLVETIVRAAAITPLPQSPPFVEGVVNLRGRIVPVLDLRRRLGLPAIPLSPQHRFVVVRVPRRSLALRVDQVNALLTVPGDAVEHAEGLVPGARTGLGFARLPDGVLVIQDPEALLSSEEEVRLDAALEGAGSPATEPVG